jgi:hypothetical protein
LTHLHFPFMSLLGRSAPLKKGSILPSAVKPAGFLLSARASKVITLAPSVHRPIVSTGLHWARSLALHRLACRMKAETCHTGAFSSRGQPSPETCTGHSQSASHGLACQLKACICLWALSVQEVSQLISFPLGKATWIRVACNTTSNQSVC